MLQETRRLVWDSAEVNSRWNICDKDNRPSCLAQKGLAKARVIRARSRKTSELAEVRMVAASGGRNCPAGSAADFCGDSRLVESVNVDR